MFDIKAVAEASQMVARLSEFSASGALITSSASANESYLHGPHAKRLAMRGQLLLERANSLTGVKTGRHGIPGFPGIALHLQPEACKNLHDAFIRDRVFAIVNDSGALCLRLPSDIAFDLIDNGLCVRFGKHLLTQPIETNRQLEISWRLLQLIYWNATEANPGLARKLWSEYAIK